MTNDYNLECLHTACNGFAPNASVQKGFARIRRETDEAGEPIAEIARQLTAALLDGLQHGNWPNA